MLSQLFRRAGRRPPQDVPHRRGYAICTLPRSGSNYFCDILEGTRVLGRPREYFNGDARRTYDDANYPDDPHRQIDQILTRGATENGVYGLKVFPGLHDLIAPHLRWIEVLPNLSFVRFRRRDVLGQAISWVRASQTRQFRATDQARGEAVYDADAIHARLRHICQRDARWQMYFARTGIAATEIDYEDLVADPAAAVAAVARAVAVPPPPVDAARSAFRRQRDEQSALWRRRFLAERGDANTVDAYADA